MLCPSYYTLSSTKLEIKAEQFLPGSERGRRKRRGEKCLKHCMHI
jgi:hypothetical protein